jgi:Putative MetA-pathway of phenol degradation
MTQLTRIILAILLLPASSIGWAQESPHPPGTVQSEETSPSEQSPAGQNIQEKPAEKTPAQETTQPAETAQPEGKAAAPGETPEGTPPAKPETTAPAQAPPQAPAPQPTGPAQTPEETPPGPEAAPEEKPQEKGAEQAIQATEEEKTKTLSTALEQAANLIKGRLELSFTETYVQTSSNKLYIDGFGILPILVVGTVEIQTVRRDSFISTLGVSYKITNKLQAGVNIPYQFTLSRVGTSAGITGNSTASSNDETLTRAVGLGDVGGSLSYHLLDETLARPSLLVGMGFKGRTGRDTFETKDSAKKPPTGSGFNSVSLSVNAVKTSDPAVVFGSLTYAYPLSRGHVVYLNPGQNLPPTVIDYNPGDNFGLGLGMAYALNYKLTLSTSYQQSVNLPARINGRKLANSSTNAVSIRFGVVWRFNEQTSMDLSVSPGLTEDAADVIFAVRIPYRF